MRLRRYTLLAAMLFATRPSLAQAPNAQVAESLFQEGVALIEAGKTKEACEKFSASYRLDPANGTLQNVASCHEKEGKTATAWAEWLELAGKAGRAGQKDRERLARTRATDLSKDLARLELKLPANANVAEIVIDTQAILRDAWTTSLPLDPGAHTVIFKAPGKRTATANIVMTPAKTFPLEVPLLADDAGAATPEPPPHAPTPAAQEPAPKDSRRTAGLVVGGVGAAVVAAGAVFGVRAMALKNDANCVDTICETPADAATRDDAKTSATISTIGIAAGLVALGVGTYLFLTSEPSPRARAAVRVNGLGIGGHW
jgi:hypothetical protein